MAFKRPGESGTSPLPTERIERAILLIRGEKVMLDEDLAKLFMVETRMLLQAVKRNSERFPPDFAFQLTRQEFQNLRSQFVISSWGGRRKLPNVFTEHGIAMLSSVLRSPQGRTSGAKMEKVDVVDSVPRFRS